MRKIKILSFLVSLISLNSFGATISVTWGTSANYYKTQVNCYCTISSGYVGSWSLPSNAYVLSDNTTLESNSLHVKWKNIEDNASLIVVGVSYGGLLNHWTDMTDITIGPLTLNMPTPSFSLGTSLNIPCHATTPVSIALNSYINTAANGIDQGETITSHFEWTLPSGWQTTSGQTGTFVGLSSISVIPASSSSSASISVRAKANLQYSSPTTLQITRNLNDFSISGNGLSDVIYNSTYRYEIPSCTGVSYSWQLPTGWSGSSTSNYIDATAGCAGNIVATMVGCNGSKTAQISITPNIITPGTLTSGSNIVCSTGATFSVPNKPTGTTISWNSTSNLTLSNAVSNSCTYSANSNGEGWIEATINATACGSSITLPRKTVWAGYPLTPTYINGFGANGIEFGENSIYEFNISPPAIQGVNNYQWVVGGGTILSGQGTNWVTVKTVANPNGLTKYFDVSVRVGNSCGWTSYLWRSGFIVTGIGPMYLIISPNPSAGETTVELASANKEALDAITEWEFEVYDTMQAMKEKKNKIKDKQTKVNSSTWKDGVYIVRAKVGGKIVTEKLVVKH